MDNNNILIVKNLKVFFENKNELGSLIRKKDAKTNRAVDDVSFEIKKSKVLSIVGETGCGKSTLGKAILLINKPTAGEIYFNGNLINNYNNLEKFEYYKKAQIIFQDPYSSLNPAMSVNEILRRPLIKLNKLSKLEAKKRIIETINLCGLSEFDLQKYPHEFSGGQRQRIGIARALLTKPIFIVADEPTSALDVSIQAQILNLLKDLKDKFNLTMLFISHNIATVLFLSDMVAVMYFGKIVEIISAKNLIKNSLHPYTLKLISAIPKGPLKEEEKLKLTKINENLTENFKEFGVNCCNYITQCKISKDFCKTNTPKLREVDEGHLIACHNFKK